MRQLHEHPALLSEEAFDFSRGAPHQAKITELKNALNTDFPIIHELCEFAREEHAAEAGAAQQTLPTLHAFLSWIRPRYKARARCWTALKLSPVPSSATSRCSA